METIEYIIIRIICTVFSIQLGLDSNERFLFHETYYNTYKTDEFKPSLLESKADKEGASSSGTRSPSPVIILTSNVIYIYKKPTLFDRIELVTSATLVSPQTCLASSKYVSEIRAKLENPDEPYPRYIAAIDDAETKSRVANIPIEEAEYFNVQEFEVSEEFQSLSLLKMARPVKIHNSQELKTIANIDYEYGSDERVSTYGNYLGPIESKLDSFARIELEAKCDGFRARLGENKNFYVYPGSPLIYNNFVIGVCDGLILDPNDNRRLQERDRIYRFILFHSV